MPKLDLTKPVQTRDGHPVRILEIGLRSEYPVVGIISRPGYDEVETWTLDGAFVSSDEHPDDLVNVPETVKRYYPVSRNAPTLQVWEYDQNTCEAIGFESLQDCRDSGYHGPVIEIVFVDGTATAVNLTGGPDANTR